MTSLKIIEEQIAKFLNSDTPEVMAIRGKWGVGKTYAWDKFLKDTAKDKKVKLQNYSYVSLFGVNSIEELKYSIFIDQKDIEDLEKYKKNNFFSKQNTAKVGGAFLQDISSFIGAGNATLSASLAIASDIVSNSIICIDDLERAGEGLSTQSVLGLLSTLKEQKGCKIVLILNDEKLEKENNKLVKQRKKESNDFGFKELREKVIDKEILFSPTSQEACEIVLGKDDVSQQLFTLCQKLNICNIRIIKKIDTLAKEMHEILRTRNFETTLITAAFSTLVLATCSYYCHDEETIQQGQEKHNIRAIPPLDFLKIYKTEKDFFNRSSFQSKLKNPSQNKHPFCDADEWEKKLNAYGYASTDALDLEIIKSVKSGYFSESPLLEAAETSNNQILAKQRNQSYEQAWEIYHNSFANNEPEVAAALFEGCKLVLNNESLRNIHTTMCILRDIGYPDKADTLIDEYIKTTEKIDDPDDYRDIGSLKDAKFIAALKKAYQKQNPERSFIDTVKYLSGKNGWSPKDTAIFARTSEDEYYDFYKNINDTQLTEWVKVCLQHGGENASKALIRIGEASQSPLNKHRLSKFSY
jgi:hypothetical protein